MPKKALASLIALCLVVASGGQGWVVFAQQVEFQYDSNKKQVQGVTLAQVVSKIQSQAVAAKLSPNEVRHAVDFVNRSWGAVQADPNTQAQLAQIADQLPNSKDPGLLFDQMYDLLQKPERQREKQDTSVLLTNKDESSQTLNVTTKEGGAQFTQKGEKVAPWVDRRTIFRYDPKTGERVIDAIVDTETKADFKETHLIYSRGLMFYLVNNLKADYYDQCKLVRQINNAETPPRIINDACKDYDGYVHDDMLKPKQIDKLISIYNQRRSEFEKQTAYKGPDGQPHSVLDYIKKVQEHEKVGTLAQLDWRELETVRKTVTDFGNANSLEMMEKYVLIELQYFFAQITNTQPKSKKDGAELSDPSMDLPENLQKALTEMEKGDLANYPLILDNIIHATKLSTEQAKTIPPSLMTAASEAMIDVAMAVQAKTAAFAPGTSKEQQDTELEECQQWLRLAQAELQMLEVGSEGMALERLKRGELQQHMGLTDDAAKAEAERLAKEGRELYLPKLRQFEFDQKTLILKQSLLTFATTLDNVQRGYYFLSTLQEKVRTLAAMARKLRMMYLQREFDKVKDGPEYQNRASELQKMVKASLFQFFLEQLQSSEALAKQKDVADRLDGFAKEFEELSKGQEADSIRDSLSGKMDQFLRLVKEMGLGIEGIPSARSVDDEKNRLSVAQARFAVRYQQFVANMRLFDSLNQLDLYIRNMASSDVVDSESTSWWDKTVKFVTGAYFTAWKNKATGGGNEKMQQKIMASGALDNIGETLDSKWGNRFTFGAAGWMDLKHNLAGKKAYEKLGANAGERQEILGLMNGGDYQAAVEKLVGLDKEAAERAQKEHEAERHEDPIAPRDLDGVVATPGDDPSMAKAQGVVSDMFKFLSPYIMTHMLIEAGVNLAENSVLAAVGGQFASLIFNTARIMQTFNRVTEALTVVKGLEKMNMLARNFFRITNFIVNFVSKTVLGWGRSGQAISGIEKAQQITAKTIGKQFAAAVGENMLAAAKMSRMMIGLSGLMAVTDHLLKGDNSQFKSAGDAFFQGAVGGLQFATSVGPFLHFMSPQADAFGEGSLGRGMKIVAEGGPAEWIGRGISKFFGSGEVAESGLWRTTLGQVEMWSNPAFRSAARVLATRGMIADGAAKYWVAAQGGKELASLARFFGAPAIDKLLHGKSDKPQTSEEKAEQAGEIDGVTSYMRRLRDAQSAGEQAAQLSWVLLPVEAMQTSRKDIENYQEQTYLFNRLSPEQLETVLASPDKTRIPVDRSLAHRLANFELVKIMRGRGRVGEFEVTPEFRKLANRRRVENRPDIEIFALAAADPEREGGVRTMDYLLKGLHEADKGGPVDAAVAPKTLSREAKLVEAALKSRRGTGPAKLFATFDKAGRLELVGDKPLAAAKSGRKGGGPFALELDVKADGGFELSRGRDGKLSDLNAAQLKRAGSADWQRAQDVLKSAFADVSAAAKSRSAQFEAVRKSGGLKPNEWFITTESVSAARELMNERLSRNKALRDRLIETQQTASVRDPKTGESKEVPVFESGGVTISGKPLVELRQLAERKVVGDSQAIERKIKADIAGGADDKAGASAKKLVELARQEVEALSQRAKAPQDASALNALKDVLSGGGQPKAKLARAQEQLRSMAQGADPIKLNELRKFLGYSSLSPETLREARRQVEGLEPGAARDRLSKILGQADPRAFKDAAAALDSLSSGAPIRTLASLSRSLKGEVTVNDLGFFARRAMDERAGKAKGVEKIALTDLRKTMESNALIQFAADHLIEVGPKGGAELDSAIRLFIDSWEQSVFGQMFQVRAAEDKAWETPADFEFRDASGGTIPSFRPHQAQALEATIRSIFAGEPLTYNLLQTSGGKTLLGFALLSFMVPYAKSRGRQGAYYVTATDDLVSQAQDEYRAMFKGAKPPFEIITYSDLMLKQAMANATGSPSPFATHDMITDEFDMLALGTPLSLGKFNGMMGHAEANPVLEALRQSVAETGLPPVDPALVRLEKALKSPEGPETLAQARKAAGEVQDLKARAELTALLGKPEAGRDFTEALKRFNELDRARWSQGLYAKYGGDNLSAHDFARLYDTNPQFRKEFDRLVSRALTGYRAAEKRLFSGDFAGSISDSYASKRKMTPKEIAAELREQHKNAFGSALKLGVLEAKYGGPEAYIRHVLQGAYEARSKGPEELGKAYTRDPGMDGIIQFHNDTALDSLDTEYRTALELREGLPVTLDFTTQAITNFRDIEEAAIRYGAIKSDLSGSLPRSMRPVMEADFQVKVLGKGTDPNKAVGLPHDIVRPAPELADAAASAFEKAGTKPVELWVDRDGGYLGFGSGAGGGLKLELTKDADGRVKAEPTAANEKVLKALDAAGGARLERVGLLLDRVNAQLNPGPEGTPFQIAQAREGIIRLLSRQPQRGAAERLSLAQERVEALIAQGRGGDRKSLEGLREAFTQPGDAGDVLEKAYKSVELAKGVDAGEQEGLKKLLSRDVAYTWVDSTAKMAALLRDLNAAGITDDHISILTAPGSSFYLQQRYMYKIKADKNIDGLKAGTVDVVVLAGQGGLRGLQAPLKAYPGGEIKMFVTDSYSLADVSLLQLLGRIDRGRVPESSKTTFTLLDDLDTVVSNRYYQEAMVGTSREPGTVVKAIRTTPEAVMGELRDMLEKRLAKPGPKDDARVQGDLRLMLAQAKARIAGGEFDKGIEVRLRTEPQFVKEEDVYSRYLAYQSLRQAIGEAEVKRIAAMSEADLFKEARKLAQDPKIMTVLIPEMRRVVEAQQLGSSGIFERRPDVLNALLGGLRGFFSDIRRRNAAGAAAPAPATP